MAYDSPHTQNTQDRLAVRNFLLLLLFPLPILDGTKVALGVDTFGTLLDRRRCSDALLHHPDTLFHEGIAANHDQLEISRHSDKTYVCQS